MDKLKSKALMVKELEDVLRTKDLEIFRKYDVIRIREAVKQVVNEAASLHTEEYEEREKADEDSWARPEASDTFVGKIREVLESDKRLTESIKSTFYMALVNGHMDRGRQLRDAFTDVNFDKEVEDAFNDAYVHGSEYLLKEIAKFHRKLKHEDLLERSQDEGSD